MSTGRSRRPVRVGAAALGAVWLTAVVAGCAPAAARTADQGTHAQAWQRVTDCIRRNGQPDWPDPTPGPDGRLGFPDDAPRTTARVQSACRAEFAALGPGPTSSPAPLPAADIGRLVQLARCLRTHGLPGWPDPGSDGRFPASAVDQPGAKQVLLSPPAACRSLVPAGGIRVAS